MLSLCELVVVVRKKPVGVIIMKLAEFHLGIMQMDLITCISDYNFVDSNNLAKDIFYNGHTDKKCL